MNTRLSFKLVLTLRSPFLFREAGGASFGLDAAALRDAWERPVLPGDQLRGVLRDGILDLAEAAPALVKATDLPLLFGTSSADARGAEADALAPDFAPARGALLCADLVASAPGLQPAQSVRVSIDPVTGAAVTGALQLAELCAPPGQEVDFECELLLLVPQTEADRLGKALRSAAALLTAIGAQKSSGFGEIIRTSLAETSRRTLALPPVAAAPPQRVAYRMMFDRPFLVDAVREADNLYVGSEVVPGAVVKGALARRLALAGEDPEHGAFAQLLSRTVFSHAFPENAQGIPAAHAMPLSLIAEQGETGFLVGDALGLVAGKGALFRGPPLTAARYAGDWKGGWAAKVATRIGWPQHEEPGRELRVHTAIRRDFGSADGGKLYATAARAHRHADAVTGVASGALRGWRLTLEPPEGADPHQWGHMLALLEQGLDGIGRTGASISVTRVDPSVSEPLPPRPMHGRPDLLAIVLTTACVMTGPEPQISAWDAYAAYWKACMPNATLVDHVASQRLAGGYVAQRRRLFSGRYVPFVLTEPGSVFLLQNADLALVAKKLRTGLPVAAIGTVPLDWRSCPFVPENGFGAFTAQYLADPIAFDEVVHV